MNKELKNKIAALPTLDEIIEDNQKDPEFAAKFKKAEGQIVANKFHKQFYERVNWRKDITYLGVPILKNPLDLWALQEIIVKCEPTIIVETGTAFGGSALFYANVLEQISVEPADSRTHGVVISIDSKAAKYVEDNAPPTSHQIDYIIGDSTSKDTLDSIDVLVSDLRRVTRRPNWIERVMVILDSNHSREHVEKELELYTPLVSVGQYLVVEDTNTNLVLPDYDNGLGPSAAIQRWKAAEDFKEDETWRERWGFSFNSYFKRVK